MAKTRQQKEVSIKQLADVLKTAKSAVFASVDGLKITDTDELRKNCRAQKVSYIISKRTLLKRALKDAGIEISDEALKGSVALIAGIEDEVAPAQIAAHGDCLGRPAIQESASRPIGWNAKRAHLRLCKCIGWKFTRSCKCT